MLTNLYQAGWGTILRRIILPLACLAVALPSAVMANLTNRWEFDNAANYQVYDPALIEVADGVAKLKLQRDLISIGTLPTYFVSNAIAVGVEVGSDALLVRCTPYDTRATFVSRVFDCGIGNAWQIINARVFGTDGPNAGGELVGNEQGLVALYHLNNDAWLDVVSGSNGLPSSVNTRFSAVARLGSHSGESTTTANTGFRLVNRNLLDGATAFTISFWMRLRSFRACDVVHAQGSRRVGLEIYSPTGIQNKPAFYVNGLLMYGTLAYETNRWHHVSATWESGTGKARIYLDGRLDREGTMAQGQTIAPGDYFYAGQYYSGPYTVDGYLDEIAIFKRSLSANEIYQLYRMPRTLLFQLRSGSSPEDLLTRAFSGPVAANASNSYYRGEFDGLVPAGGFSPTRRYLQYKAYLMGGAGSVETPYFDSVSFFGSLTNIHDNSIGDFAQGVMDVGVTSAPAVFDTPYLGLSKRANGGYQENGTYTSRALEKSAIEKAWHKIKWTLPPELAGESRMIGLWHLNFSVSDAYGGKHGTNVNNSVGFTSVAKLGGNAAVFDGANSRIDIGSMLPRSVRTVEWWMYEREMNDGVMELAGISNVFHVVISNGLVTPLGLSAYGPAVYVNGQGSSRKLGPGWNHVALAFDLGVPADFVVLGRAGSDYFSGMMDEVAIYDTRLGEGELKSHFISGRQPSAGLPRFRVRGFDTLPAPSEAQEPFRDGGGGTGGYITDNTGGSDLAGNLPGLVKTKKYLQYRVFFAGDGSVTPTLGQVQTEYYGGEVAYREDTLEAIGLGVYDGDTTKWVADEVKLPDLAAAPGLVNMDTADSEMQGLWHMDETNWPSGSSVLDAKGAYHGQPQGGATVSSSAKVGTGCGLFDGVNGYVQVAAGISVPADCTVMAWFKTAASNRSAIVAHETGRYAIEMNSDGSAQAPGELCFVVDAGSRTVVRSAVGGLNDGAWHHVVGMRAERHLHLIVDGAAVGSVALAGGVGVLDGSILFGKRGGASEFFQGSIDEVALFSRKMTLAEIRRRIAVGTPLNTEGSFVSGVINAGGPAIWERLAWQEDAPYGDPLVADPIRFLVGLWHFDEGSGTAAADASGNDLHGSLTPGAGWATGRMGTGVVFNGTSGYVNLPAGGALESADVTVEAWIQVANVASATVLDKRNGTQGYALGIDADGRPYLWTMNTTIRAPGGLLPGVWTHLAGTAGSGTASLYVDGQLAAVTPISALVQTGTGASVGANSSGSDVLNGVIDELAIHARVLGSEEILDHSRSGFGSLRIQVRYANSIADVLAAPFVGPSGVGSYFDQPSGALTLNGGRIMGQFFQFRTVLSTEDGLRAPRFQGAVVSQSRYPSSRPWVAPTTGSGTPFVGNLITFSHAMTTNLDSAVRYQISGDAGANWYYWGGGAWEPDALGWGWSNANSAATVSSQIGSFYKQLYQARGGTFSFRAYLDSDGAMQTAVDWTQLVKSRGRITVLQPNGEEVGRRSWLVGTPYDIQWSRTGVVGNVVMIDLSKDDGATVFRRLGTNVANNGQFTTVIGEEPGARYRVLVSDPADGTIYDWSDGSFELRALFHLSVPNGGEHWYCGKTNTIVWESPKSGGFTLEGPAWIWFSPDNGSSWKVVLGVSNYNGRNTCVWNTPADNAQLRASLPTMPLGYEHLIPSNLASIVSETALMGVSAPGASVPTDVNFYGDISDAIFTNAGIGITFPYENVGVRMGNPVTIEWTAAGAGNLGAKIEFFDGQSWAVLSSNATCNVGDNTFDTVLRADRPSTAARIRITANADTNVVGLSDPFTLADINIVEPVGRGGTGNWSIWQLFARHNVRWTAAGAGDLVNILYSTDSGTNWLPVVRDYPNLNSSGVLVTNASSDWVIPGPPSDKVRVRVQSAVQTNLYTDTGDFDFSGVQVVRPNGTSLDGVSWEFSQGGPVEWKALSAGAQVSIMIAYEDNPQTNDFETLLPGVTAAAGSWSILPQLLRRPSNYARIRVLAPNPPVEATEFTPMDDVSDTNFVIRGVSVVQPLLGEVLTLARLAVNALQWYSAGAGGAGVATVYYSADGGQTFGATPFMPQVLNEDDDRGTGRNIQNVTLSRTLTPSDNARLKVVVGSYSAYSPRFVARGIRVTDPVQGAAIPLSTASYRLKWQVAGLATSATAAPDISFAGTNGPWQGGGLQASVNVTDRQLDWALDPDLLPTTNATIRLSVTSPAPDTDVVVYSDPFLLRGVKVVRPVLGDTLELGQPTEVTVVSAGMGLERATVQYSADGGVTYDQTSIAEQWALVDGSNTLTWIVEKDRDFTRMPSADARLRVVCGSATNVSKAFRVEGVKITAPTRTDIWSSDETNTIRWVDVGIGGPYSLYLVQWDGTNRIGSNFIALVASGSEYAWTMASGTAASNVSVEVTAGGRRSSSELFEIVKEPTVKIVSPQSGEFWKVNSTNVIRWSRGGSMSDQFRVALSVAGYPDEVELYSGPCPLANGMFGFVWDPVTNTVGPARISVSNLVNTRVSGSVDDFHIAGRFAVSPFGLDNYALSTKAVSWVTYGTVQMVDLYYSTDPLRATSSWVRINAVPYAGNIGHRMPATPYPWQLPNIKTPIMYLRIQDHAYPEAFRADRTGPYDDMGPFPVKYYTITWSVLDNDTGGHLSRLSVSDSSGWSEANLTSPIVHEYPYGTWDTVWFREYFSDGVVFNWDSDPSRTNVVRMFQNISERGFQVLGDFSFDMAANRLIVLAWIQRAGQVLPDPTRCDVTIYSSAGQTVSNLASTAVQGGAGQPTGVFRMEWNGVTNVLAYGATYFAKVTIEYSGKTYSSLVTYSLRLPMDAVTGDQILDAIGSSQVNVQSNVLAVASNLQDLAALQSTFRSNAMDRLDTLTGGVVGVQIGISNLTDVVNAFSNEAMRTLGDISTNVSLILPLVTNIEQKLAGVETLVASTQARILTRPDSMVYGSTNTILYKSTAGFASTVSITVSNSMGGGPLVEDVFMSEVVPGLYQRDLVANWGSNSYVITCSDPPSAAKPGWDSIVVRVGAAPLTGNVALDQLLGDVARIEQRITNVTQMLNGLTNTTGMLQLLDADVGHVESQLTNILGSVTNMQQTVGTLTNLATAAQVLLGIDWGAVSNVGGLASSLSSIQTSVTNMQATLNSVTNLAGTMGMLTGIQGSISNLQVSVGSLTNLGAVVGSLTNVDWGAVSNVGGLSSSLTNIQSALATIQTSVGGVSNYVVMLTNLPVLANNVTDIQGAIAGLQSSIGGLTNLSGVVSVLTNYDWSAISNIGALASTLTEIKASVTNMQTSMGVLTNLDLTIAALTNVNWGAISNIGNVSGMTAYLTNIQTTVLDLQSSLGGVSNYVVMLTNLPVVAGNVASIQGVVGGLQTSVSGLVAQLQGVDLNLLGRQITNLTTTINGMGDLALLQSQITNMVAAVNGMTDLTVMGSNVAVLVQNMQGVNLASLGTQMTNLAGVITGIGNLATLQDQITNMVAAIAGMQDLSVMGSNVAVLVQNMQGANLADLGAQMTNLTGVITGMGNLTALQTEITNMATVINAYMRDFAVAGSNVAVLAQSMQGANLADLGAQMTNLSGVITGMGNLAVLQDQITNMVAAIANMQDLSVMGSNVAVLVQNMQGVNLASLGTQMTNLAGVITGIGNLATLQDQITNMVAAIAGMQDLTVMGSNVATLVQNMQGVSLGALSAQMTNLMSAIAGIGSLTNVDWSAASNVAGIASALTNIQTTVSQLPVLAGNVTNLQTQIAALQAAVGLLTNLSSVAGALTNVDWGAVAGVSTLSTAVSNIQNSVANIGAIHTAVNNVAAQFGAVNWAQLAGVPGTLNQFAPALQGLGTTAGSDLAAILRGIQELDRQAGQSGTSIGDVQSGLRALQLGMDALSRLQERLGGAESTQPTDTLYNRLSRLAEGIEKVSGQASDAAKSAMSAKNEAANAAAAIQGLRDAMGRGDETGVSAGLTQLREQMAAVKKAIEDISISKEAAAIEESVRKIASDVGNFAKSLGYKWLTEMKEPPKLGVGEGLDGKQVENFNAVLLDLRSRLDFLQRMIEELRDKPVVEESLVGGA